MFQFISFHSSNNPNHLFTGNFICFSKEMFNNWFGRKTILISSICQSLAVICFALKMVSWKARRNEQTSNLYILLIPSLSTASTPFQFWGLIVVFPFVKIYLWEKETQGSHVKRCKNNNCNIKETPTSWKVIWRVHFHNHDKLFTYLWIYRWWQLSLSFGYKQN